MLYCWHIFQERPHAFLEQIISRHQTKIWKYLTIFLTHPFPPILLLSCLLTSTATRQLLACAFQMWSIISSEWILGAEDGGREEGKEKEEERQDPTLQDSEMCSAALTNSGTYSALPYATAPCCEVALLRLPSTFSFPLPFEHRSFPVTCSKRETGVLNLTKAWFHFFSSDS